jgi:hypothetical protein
VKIKRTVTRALPTSGQKPLCDLKLRSIRTGRSLVEAFGYNVAWRADYYSPLLKLRYFADVGSSKALGRVIAGAGRATTGCPMDNVGNRG